MICIINLMAGRGARRMWNFREDPMPISENRRLGAFAAGLLAGVSVLALAGGALAAGSTAPRFDIVMPDLSVQLADSGEGGEAGDYDDAYEEAIDAPDEAIDGAYDAIDAPPGEAVAASLSVLRHAADDDEKSFDNGRMTDAHEYQDGRGLYLAVRDDIDNHADALAAYNPEKLTELMAALDEAGKAWPTVGLPAAASMSPQELNAAIARYEIAALAFR
jgi:hypothetical protein